MWKTATISVGLAVVLSAAIGAGIIHATSGSSSTARTIAEPSAGVAPVAAGYGAAQPAFTGAALNTDPAAPPAAQANGENAGQPDEATPPPSAADPDSGDSWSAQMREHMDAVHGEGSFDAMLQYMQSGQHCGLAGGTTTNSRTGGAGGGMMGGGPGGGMMGW